MNYQTFVQKCVEIVKTSRIQQVKHSKEIKVVHCLMPKHLEPGNVHFQVYMRSKTSRIKLEEWSFITCKTLMKSINCEDNESDPELDSIQIHQQNFFQILTKLLSNVTPRLLVKVLQPHILQFCLVGNEHDLVPFDGDNTFVIKVGDYEGNNFQCSVSLKYNYQYQIQQEEEDYHSEIDDSCEFQLLIDPAYQKKRKQEQAFQQNRKYSENVFHQRQFSPPPQLKPSSRSTHDVRIQIQEQPLVKKTSGLSRIAQLYKQIDFKDKRMLRGSTLQQFLAL